MPAVVPSPLPSPLSSRLHHALAWACALLAVAWPLAVLYQLTTMPLDGLLARAHVPLTSVQIAMLEVAPWQRALAVLLGMVPVACMSLGLLCAMRCFSTFARGGYFSLRAVRSLRGFAAGIFASVVSGFLVAALTSVLLTAGAPPGERALALSLSSHQLMTLLFAGMVWQIAAVMSRAVELAEENAQFV